MAYDSRPAIDDSRWMHPRLPALLSEGMVSGRIARVENPAPDTLYVTFNDQLAAWVALDTLATIVDQTHPDEVHMIDSNEKPVSPFLAGSIRSMTVRLWWD